MIRIRLKPNLALMLSLTAFSTLEAGNMTYTKPTKAEIKAKLTPIQYSVTQDSGTEPAFQNEYYNNKEPGLYVDRVSGEPLFTSLDKFDSGTGWPSFTKPVDESNIVLKLDGKLFLKRTEVRSKKGDSHLGHLFDDGPAPTKNRYCINSASLRFIPVAQLEAEGYGEYRALFPETLESDSKSKKDKKDKNKIGKDFNKK